MSNDDSDSQALVEVVATLEQAQQQELVEEFIALVHPDAVWVTGAVVAVRQRPIDLHGVPLADRSEGRPTYVMAKDTTGAWTIRAGQNTLVADD